MVGVLIKFSIASICLLAAPVAILYGFNHKFFPGSSHISRESVTIWSGVLAVISVNVVIAFYIYMAMKEPSHKHEPDHKFLADAKASIKQHSQSESELYSHGTKQE
ncbi:Vacuolar ATPase assembly integral membrane protein VMA21-like domain [Striga hermonthica]|uniref:Vacuolar ATPase assembly integral membrane protein VMA21 homolog n=1 Tax=Striga hermonthica TaxID=68872 RepID=A0A9N7NDU7_STRHE|nr:Vacuolar ATPase assembly integral membrane protein VMA21-like domain [Striga hermonthica]